MNDRDLARLRAEVADLRGRVIRANTLKTYRALKLLVRELKSAQKRLDRAEAQGTKPTTDDNQGNLR